MRRQIWVPVPEQERVAPTSQMALAAVAASALAGLLAAMRGMPASSIACEGSTEAWDALSLAVAAVLREAEQPASASVTRAMLSLFVTNRSTGAQRIQC